MNLLQRPKIELADIFNQFGHLIKAYSVEQLKVVQAIKNCRTSVLGGHSVKCSECTFVKNEYNSCRNRHCPKCQFLSRVKWVEKRKEELLPCSYFHVVFTVPSELNSLILLNQKICYKILFKASSETLKEVASNAKNLGLEIGFIGILHTWAQNLIDHPHIHYIVPAGGFDKHGDWNIIERKYLLPVKILSKVFRGKFLNLLEKSFQNGELKFNGNFEHLRNKYNFKRTLALSTKSDWVIYAKKPFGGPNQVINYLGNYTHRIAISNYRLVKIENNKIFFKCRNKSDNKKSKIISLEANEFIRRFLLHILPKGFCKIRHFGFLGNKVKKANISEIKNGKDNHFKIEVKSADSKLDWKAFLKNVCGIDLAVCPICKKGKLIEGSLIHFHLDTS